MKRIVDFFHHLLIPREDNNYRAKALHPDFLTYYLIIAFFLTLTFKQLGLSNVLGFATDITVDKLYQLTNQERERNSLPDLKYNSELAQAAADKAADMFAKNYWAHYGPDGETPWDFILGAGYHYEYAGENLAKNFLFSQNVVDAWMNSPTHRENILRSNYTDVGFAVVNGTLNGEQTTLVVQMFGKPQGASAIASAAKPAVSTAPTLTPTVAPTSAAVAPLSGTKTAQNSTILTKQTTQPKINLLGFVLNMNLVFLSFLLLALALDFYFASKLHVVRIGSKNLAHFIFIGFIILGLLVFTRGAIL